MYNLERVAVSYFTSHLSYIHTNNIAANIMFIYFVIFSYIIAVHTLPLLFGLPPRSLRGTYVSAEKSVLKAFIARYCRCCTIIPVLRQLELLEGFCIVFQNRISNSSVQITTRHRKITFQVNYEPSYTRI